MLHPTDSKRTDPKQIRRSFLIEDILRDRAADNEEHTQTSHEAERLLQERISPPVDREEKYPQQDLRNLQDSRAQWHGVYNNSYGGTSQNGVHNSEFTNLGPLHNSVLERPEYRTITMNASHHHLYPSPTSLTLAPDVPVMTSFLPYGPSSCHRDPPLTLAAAADPHLMTSYVPHHHAALMTSYRTLGEVNVSHPTYGESYLTYNPDATVREFRVEPKPWTWGPYLHHRSPSKRKGGQVRFTNEQTIHLESKFERQKYLSPEERRAMAKVLHLSGKQVKTWFQNRRAKWRRLKQEAPSPDQTYGDDGRHMTSPTSTSDVTNNTKT